ncbi:site-specific integrase [Pusillimonas sp. ANT_WB101]|uniref:tyrosine-type recombinase/integrase n=1 Tax=Pusillimonas sp. ANT_WB101 TaxID=2597356 RepID=UPI0011EC3295|nr:site-specific integrase [Pusillimonas sp. ANT_WB101]KAA0911462.1 tyrosine-type recombinase/integrase [Pusillimonas sp. ANT_WB101]
MATISKRNGKYSVRVRVLGFPCLHRTFNDRRAAQVWAVQVEDEINRGVYDFGKRELPTLAQALADYAKKVTAAKRGAVKEAYLINALARLPLARKPLDQIRPDELARLRDQWAQSLSPATVQRRLSVLSHLYNTAIKEWGHQELDNPLLRISKLKITNHRSRTVCARELDAVLAATASETVKHIARLAWHTAARLSELATLRWEYVDLQDGTAHFPITKNGLARTVPLAPGAISILERLKPKTKTPPTGAIFDIRPDSISKRWTLAVKKARKNYEAHCIEQGLQADADWLTNVRFHDLRHSAVTRLAEHGLSSLELAAISGHKSLSMLSRYTHIRAETLAVKLASLEARA